MDMIKNNDEMFTIDNNVSTMNDNVFTMNVNNLPENLNTFIVKCTDAYGNSDEEKVEFYVIS